MAFALKLCWINRHTPDRRNAAWDGDMFVSECTGCGKPIRRIKHGKWTEDQRPSRLARMNTPAP